MYLNGIDRAGLAEMFLGGKKLGLVTNHTGKTRNGIPSAAVLKERYNLVKLFCPEHGLNGIAQAGEKVDDSVDSVTGLPVQSLYGSVCDGIFDGLEAVAFDIQDIGCRYYTYISTLAVTMKECRKAGIPLVVFDRYNPLGLNRVEGTLLDERFSSFVGMYELPTRHGMTVGEYAFYLNEGKGIGCNLTVIRCDGLERWQTFDNLDFTWIKTSPNMPDYGTVVTYAGTCLIEGTNVSEGRGTDKPFRLIGAPWINGAEISREMNEMGLYGVSCAPAEFIPSFSKYSGEKCSGIEITVTDRNGFRSCDFGIYLLDTLRRRCPEFRTSGFLYNLMGTDAFDREGFAPEEFIRAEEKKVLEFKERTRRHFIYM